jgi:hypothetical protein
VTPASVLAFGICAVFKQKLHELNPASPVKRRPTLFVPGVRVRAVLQQKLNQRNVTHRHSLVQRRLSVCIPGVRVSAVSKQKLHNRSATLPHRSVERRLAPYVFRVWVCAVFKQKLG